MGRFERLVILGALALAGCGSGAPETYTLYRNSNVSHAMRIHWATFDAPDGNAYNLNNCLMAARLLNANVSALAKSEGHPRDTSLGFWCEGGAYEEHGAIPGSFSEAFPTDA
ncbi:MAG: hypothetical protein ACTHLU_08135 [Novosphingobium sp.]